MNDVFINHDLTILFLRQGAGRINHNLTSITALSHLKLSNIGATVGKDNNSSPSHLPFCSTNERSPALHQSSGVSQFVLFLIAFLVFPHKGTISSFFSQIF